MGDNLMQPTLNTIEEILDAHLALMATDTEAWADLLAEDVIVDFPYAPSLGRPGRLEGRSAAYNHIKTALTQMQNLTFSNVRKYPTTDPNVLWAELHGSALIPTTGRRYEQDYVVRLKIKDGKTVYYSEYWNPVALTDAFGNT
ncbi:nuclear transport factor 2 family protein [Scytonema sp. NUACC26]|uniref:nuclear transport factor 2 family protein n=1 Tax=Scytonema sp. NUACC26 TaxID=3140176 RepID=UPI0038B3FB02